MTPETCRPEEAAMRTFPCALLLTTSLALVQAGAEAQEAQHDHDHAAPEQLGRVHFPTSCKAEVQPRFERGVALLHSFAYGEAARTFAEVAEKDPDCAMARWGMAMSYFHPIWGPSPEADFAAGRAAAQEKAPAAPTERERDYLAAIRAFYQGDEVPHPARVVAFEQAMA